MNIWAKLVLALSCLALVACATQTTAPPKTKTTDQPKSQTKTVAAKPAPSNVQISADTSRHADIEGTYYVQNRVIASGGVVSGAIMGS